MGKKRLRFRNMKKATFFVLLFCLISLSAFQTEKIESLFAQFDRANTQKKPEIALEIGEKYYPDFAKKQEKYLLMGRQAALVAQEHSQEFEILLSLAIHSKRMGKIEEAMQYVDNAISKAEKFSNDSYQIKWRLVKSNIWIHQSKIPEAINVLEEALEFAENDKENTATIYNDLGRCYFQIEYYEKAFTYYKKAYDIYEELKDSSSMGSLLVNLANVYNRTNKKEEALTYYEKAAEVLKKSGNNIDYANSRNNVAATYVQMNNYPLALETHQKAMAIYEQENSTKLMAYSLYNIGNLYRNMEEYAKSDSHYKKSLSLFEENNYPKGIAICIIGLAENLILQEKYKQAYDYIVQAEKLVENLEIPQHKLSVHNLYVHYYKGVGDFEKAFDALTNTHEIRNSLSDKRHNEKLIEMQTKFQIDQKIKRIEVLEKDKKIHQLRLLVLIIALIGIFGIAILYRHRFLEKNKANKIIQKHQKELELVNNQQKQLLDELEELNLTKNKLFSILAHDLKNGFTSLMKGTKLLSEKIHMISAETVPVIAEELHKSSVTMYEMLQNLIVWGQLQSKRIEIQPRAIVLQEKVESICKLFASLAEEKRIKIERTIPVSVTVLADSATLSSVLQNLIHNAIKFTPDEGKISISCEETDKHIRLFIADSGVGIKENDQENLFKLSKMKRSRGTKGEKGTGLGLIICKEFVEMNQGELMIESEYGKGTTFTIVLPKA